MSLDQPFVEIAALIEMLSPSGPLRLWTGQGNFDLDGKTFLSAFPILSVSPIEDDTEVSAKGVTISLSAVPDEIVAIALNPQNYGMPTKIWLAQTVDGAVVGEPYELFTGSLDQVSLRTGSDAHVVIAEIESDLVRLLIPKPYRYTQADHAARNPGDKSFEYTPSVASRVFNWGEFQV